mgnify:CR=1 FL=1
MVGTWAAPSGGSLVCQAFRRASRGKEAQRSDATAAQRCKRSAAMQAQWLLPLQEAPGRTVMWRAAIQRPYSASACSERKARVRGCCASAASPPPATSVNSDLEMRGESPALESAQR